MPTKKVYDFTKNFKSGIVSHKTTNITNQDVLPDIIFLNNNESNSQTKCNYFDVQDEDYEYVVTTQK